MGWGLVGILQKNLRASLFNKNTYRMNLIFAESISLDRTFFHLTSAAEKYTILSLIFFFIFCRPEEAD
jgi:uncharacterized membrane protein YuzA (DUF378 family)